MSVYLSSPIKKKDLDFLKQKISMSALYASQTSKRRRVCGILLNNSGILHVSEFIFVIHSPCKLFASQAPHLRRSWHTCLTMLAFTLLIKSIS